MKKALVIANLVGFVHFLWNDIRFLQSLGYDVSFSANADGAFISDLEELEKMGVSFYDLSASSKKPFSVASIKTFLELKRILAQQDYDLIHCHTPIVGLLARIAANKYRKKGTRVIYTSHGFSFTKYSPKKDWLMYYTIEKIASLFTDTIITINEEDYEYAKKFWCSDVRKINGVGVNTAKYHDIEIDVVEYKKGLGLPTDKIMILSVGELSVRKNHQIIIKAMGALPQKSDYIYVICGKEVGGTTITDHLKRLAKEQGVDLYLLGHRSDIPEIMHCSDIGAIPSVREGLGLAGIQSLCAGVPLVGTDVQGIREYILPDKTGYLCEPYDIEEVVNSIKQLSYPDVRERLRLNCYEIAQKFDERVSCEQMKEIYMDVLAGRT